MKAVIFFFLCTLFTLPTVFGQIKIGDNPQNIDDASVLELESSSKVLVITRVTTAQMEAIAPQRGGVVYNTDTACIHYFDGVQWINLCDAVSFEITNDPIINNRSTIEITQSEGGYNLEVAKNSILGDNIVDGGIGPDDIQDNSIGQEKLAAESVGSSELRENSVGSEELRDGTIVPTDIANTDPGRVLTTDENGIVQWEDANEIYELTFSKIDTTLSITRSTTPGENSVNLAGLIGSDDQNLGIASLTNEELTIEIENGASTTANLGVFATDADLTFGLSLKEDLINKDPNPTLGTSNDAYPTQNAVKTYVDSQIGGVTTDDDITSATLTGASVLRINEGASFVEVSLANLEESQEIEDETLRATLAENENATAITNLQTTRENVINKNPDTNLGTSDTDYPTQNAVKVYVDNEIADIVTSGGSDPVNEQNLDFEVIGGELRITDIAGPLSVPLSLIDTNTQLTDAEIGAFGYIKTDLDEQNLADVLILGNNAGSNPIIGLDISTDPTSAATRGYVDANLGGTQDLEAVLGNGTSAGNNQINDLLDPSLPQDAATKKYVDDNIVAAGGGVPDDELITGFNLNTTTLSITEDGVVWPVNLDTSFATDEELTNATNTNATAIVANTMALDNKEDSANKSDDVNLADATNTLFPTELAVKTYVDNQIATAVGDDDITAVTFDGATLTVDEGTTTFFADLSDLEESADILALQADVDLNEADADTAIALKEDSANKSDDVNLADATNTLFPTELAVKTYVDNQIATAVGDDDITAVTFDGATLTVDEGTTTFFADLSDLEESADILALQADVDLNEADADTAIALKEDSANKSDDVNLADATNTLFPTELAVKTYVDNQIATAVGDDDITAVTFDGATLTVDEGTTTFFADLSDLEESADILALQADVDLNEADADTAIALKEDSANKSDDVTLADATNTLFPTELAVKTYVDNQILGIAGGNNLSNTDLTQTAGENRTYDLNGNELYLTGSGNVGIGQFDFADTDPTTPNSAEDKLDVIGQIRARNGFAASPGTANLPSYGFYTNNDNGTGMFRAANLQLGFSTNGTEAVRIDADQNVGIGLTNPLAKLHVDGDIRAEGSFISNDTDINIPDYVFQKFYTGKSTLNDRYTFQSLEDIERFVRQNNHLPGIKSAAAIKEQGFWNLGEASRMNLEKIEELFLHTIEQEKKIKTLQEENRELAKQMDALQLQVEEIKKLLVKRNE